MSIQSATKKKSEICRQADKRPECEKFLSEVELFDGKFMQELVASVLAYAKTKHASMYEDLSQQALLAFAIHVRNIFVKDQGRGECNRFEAAKAWCYRNVRWQLCELWKSDQIRQKNLVLALPVDPWFAKAAFDPAVLLSGSGDRRRMESALGAAVKLEYRAIVWDYCFNEGRLNELVETEAQNNPTTVMSYEAARRQVAKFRAALREEFAPELECMGIDAD